MSCKKWILGVDKKDDNWLSFFDAGRAKGPRREADAVGGAYQAVEQIRWTDCCYRKDIAAKTIKSSGKFFHTAPLR